jgi:excisionase family DNA binding protein
VSWPHLSEALPQLATPAEVAEQLGFAPESVSRMCRQGRLPGVKVGGRWYIHVGKLREQMNKTTAGPA